MSIVSWLLDQHGRIGQERDARPLVSFTKSTSAPTSTPNAILEPARIWVLLSGDTLDHELIALACAMASERHASRVRAIYGIEVPRARPIDDEMPSERARAEAILAEAARDAEMCDIVVEPECVQARSIGESLVRASTELGCAVLLVGLPYRAEGDDEAQLSETVEDVLRRAPCRVCVVRGRQPITA